jgi:hypothetical protein
MNCWNTISLLQRKVEASALFWFREKDKQRTQTGFLKRQKAHKSKTNNNHLLLVNNKFLDHQPELWMLKDGMDNYRTNKKLPFKEELMLIDHKQKRIQFIKDSNQLLNKTRITMNLQILIIKKNDDYNKSS